MKYQHVLFSFAIVSVKINSNEIFGVIIIDSKDFGQYIKNLRTEKNLTLTELAKISGVSQPHLSHIENGKRRIPPPETLKKIANGLDIDYYELMVLAGYIEKTEGIDKQIEGIRKEIEEIEQYKEDQELKLKYFNSLKTQEKLIATIETMSDLQHLLLSDSNVYYKDHLLTKEEKEKLLTIIETILG